MQRVNVGIKRAHIALALLNVYLNHCNFFPHFQIWVLERHSYRLNENIHEIKGHLNLAVFSVEDEFDSKYPI